MSFGLWQTDSAERVGGARWMDGAGLLELEELREREKEEKRRYAR
jgi:hypothetical protein